MPGAERGGSPALARLGLSAARGTVDAPLTLSAILHRQGEGRDTGRGSPAGPAPGSQGDAGRQRLGELSPGPQGTQAGRAGALGETRVRVPSREVQGDKGGG